MRKYFQNIVNQSDLYINQGKKIYENLYLFVHPFDMECSSKSFHILNNWDEAPNMDDEWIYMRARMSYLDSLFLCFEKEKDTKYLEKIKAIIYDYIDAHSPFVKSKSTRTLDSGIRIINIIRALIYFRELKYNIDENKIKNHLKENVNYLLNNYESKYDLSNWGFIIQCGIYTYAWYFDEIELKTKSKKQILSLLENQILSDGLHWEKSAMYHMQIIIYLVWIIKIEKDEKLLHFLQTTSDALKSIHDFNHNLIPFGDSDVVCVDAILSICDSILNIKSKYKLTIESLMWGNELCENYSYQFEQPSNFANFSESGYTFLNKDAFHFSHYNTPMSSSHTHLDLLHFNYYYHTPIFIDSGRGTYMEVDTRKILKEISSHNSININRKKYIKASWEYYDYPVVNPTKSAHFDDGYIGESSYYIDGNLVRRRYILINKLLLISDSVFSKNPFTQTTYFNLDSNVHLENNLINDEVVFDYKNGVIKDKIYSKKYNEIIIGKQIVFESNEEKDYQNHYLIYPKNYEITKKVVYQKDQIVEDEIAYSYEIMADENYLVFIKNKEIYEDQKCFHIGDVAVYGNVVVFKKVNDTYIKIATH